MVKALGLSSSQSSFLAGTGEMLIWDTMRPSRPCSKAAAHTSVLLTALSRNPLVSCASLESKRVSAPTNTLPGSQVVKGVGRTTQAYLKCLPLC